MKRSKSDWLFLFEDQKNSGMNIKDYCFANVICPGTFYNARRRYKDCLTDTGSVSAETVECTASTLAKTLPADTESSSAPVEFIQIHIDDPEITPAAAPSAYRSHKSGPPGSGDDPGILDFICNGIRLTIPVSVSDLSLFRIMKACVSL